jgi:DNA-binding response OmpR family regulator
VVDDEETSVRICQEALSLEGYEVIGAGGPREAVELLAAREVDAIVCDVQMPHNGRRVFEFLLDKYPQLSGRFIFITGSPTKKTEIERMELQIPCLLKPFSIRVLLDTLRATLA